jgi:cytochrome c biogenesis protein CcmG, thiol:disulfide interchange protein DsbE
VSGREAKSGPISAGSGIMCGMNEPEIKPLRSLPWYRAIAAVLLAGLLVGCHHAPLRALVWGPVTCGPNKKDVQCVACSRSACCAEFQACAVDAPCPCWLSGRAALAGNESVVARCGSQNAAYHALAACLDAHCGSECPADVAHHPLLGKPAPAIIAERVGGEGPGSLAEAHGKIVIVDFWATYCGPCKRSFQSYQAIVDRYHGDVAVLAVSGDDPESTTVGKLLDFAKETRVRFPILWDTKNDTQKSYRLQGGFPKTFFVDRAGIVRFVHEGYTPADLPQIAAEIESLVGGQLNNPSGDAAPSPGRSPP